MPNFTLDGAVYEYLKPSVASSPEEIYSWEYGRYPKVMADIPITGGGTVNVYAHASRWTKDRVVVRWEDDADQWHWAWVPTTNVRKITDSEWDLEEYRRCPESLRGVRWGDRLPGFLPE